MAFVGEPPKDGDPAPGPVHGRYRDFDAFYEREYGRIARLALVLTGRRALAEELAQDAFLSALRHWDRVSAYDDPAAWIRRVMMNRSTSGWRRTITELRLIARLALERTDEPALCESDEELWRAVRALPTRQRQVIALVVLEDRSVSEVAAVLGCSQDSVRTHLRRARTALARQLAEENEHGP